MAISEREQRAQAGIDPLALGELWAGLGVLALGHERFSIAKKRLRERPRRSRRLRARHAGIVHANRNEQELWGAASPNPWSPMSPSPDAPSDLALSSPLPSALVDESFPPSTSLDDRVGPAARRKESDCANRQAPDDRSEESVHERWMILHPVLFRRESRHRTYVSCKGTPPQPRRRQKSLDHP